MVEYDLCLPFPTIPDCIKYDIGDNGLYKESTFECIDCGHDSSSTLFRFKGVEGGENVLECRKRTVGFEEDGTTVLNYVNLFLPMEDGI